VREGVSRLVAPLVDVEEREGLDEPASEFNWL